MATAPDKPKLPAELKPEQVVAVCDSREQLPLDLAPLQVVGGTLTTGDYSLRGLEHLVAIERKSFSTSSTASLTSSSIPNPIESRSLGFAFSATN